MAIKRALKILDKHHLRQYQQHQRSSLYIGFIEIDRRQFIFHFEATFCAKLFSAGGDIWVKRPSDAVTPAMIEMLMVMLTMMFITISDRICCLYIVYTIHRRPFESSHRHSCGGSAC